MKAKQKVEKASFDKMFALAKEFKGTGGEWDKVLQDNGWTRGQWSNCWFMSQPMSPFALIKYLRKFPSWKALSYSPRENEWRYTDWGG